MRLAVLLLAVLVVVPIGAGAGQVQVLGPETVLGHQCEESGNATVGIGEDVPGEVLLDGERVDEVDCDRLEEYTYERPDVQSSGYTFAPDPIDVVFLVPLAVLAGLFGVWYRRGEAGRLELTLSVADIMVLLVAVMGALVSGEAVVFLAGLGVTALIPAAVIAWNRSEWGSWRRLMLVHGLTMVAVVSLAVFFAVSVYRWVA